MTLEEAIDLLRKKLSHITRDYTPEDQAFDLVCKYARGYADLLKNPRAAILGGMIIEGQEK